MNTWGRKMDGAGRNRSTSTNNYEVDNFILVIQRCCKPAIATGRFFDVSTRASRVLCRGPVSNRQVRFPSPSAPPVSFDRYEHRHRLDTKLFRAGSASELLLCSSIKAKESPCIMDLCDDTSITAVSCSMLSG